MINTVTLITVIAYIVYGTIKNKDVGFNSIEEVRESTRLLKERAEYLETVQRINNEVNKKRRYDNI